jgi:SAM-dependent methyltransferase
MSFDFNKEYWNNRYKTVAKERIVGHIDWSKEKYDEENIKWIGYFNKLLSLIENPIDNILELGCGIGRWKPFLSSYGKYHGCDIVEDYNRDFAFEPIKEGVIPFADKKFDLIWTCVVLQHVMDEDLLNFYAKQFFDRTVDSGHLLITENTSKNKDSNYIKFRDRSFYENLFTTVGFKLLAKDSFVSEREEHCVFLFNR